MQELENPRPPFYVSITALRIGSPMLVPLFWWHTLRAARQARVAEGNLSVDQRRIGDAWHTLSVWRDRAAMLSYVQSGAHRTAVRGYPWAAMGRVAGFAAHAVPGWREVPDLLRRQGRAL